MDKKLSIKRIREKYQNEWVLLLDPDISLETKIEAGRVVFHSKDRGEIHRKLSDFRGDKAIVFTGEIPEGVGVLLQMATVKFNSDEKLILEVGKVVFHSTDCVSSCYSEALAEESQLQL